jgi:hypothetical protein
MYYNLWYMYQSRLLLQVTGGGCEQGKELFAIEY